MTAEDQAPATEAVEAPAAEAVVTSYADLAVWLGGDVVFTTELMRLAGQADWRQLAQLRYGFPREVKAFEAWARLTDKGRLSPGPPVAVLAKAVTDAELADASVRAWAGEVVTHLVKALFP